jgi:hypothetical protein
MTPKENDIITLQNDTFKVREVKRNSCINCDAGDHCNEIYNRFHEGTKMGCQNIIFKLIETKND